MKGTPGATLRRRIRAVLVNPWFKAVATLTVLGFVLYWLRGQMPFFAEGFSAVVSPHWGWVAVALVFSYLSMSSYGSVQKVLLQSAGVKVGYWESVGLVFSANAFSTCIPGGQVFGTTLTYRKTRQWGATRVVASWQLVISGVLSTVGIVLLALMGFFLVGRVSNPFLLMLSAVGLVAIVVVVQWAARNPDRIEEALLAMLAWVNARRRKPADHGATGVRKIVKQAEAVEMTKTQFSKAFAFSLLNWVADIGCLWAAAHAVGAQPSIGGLCIAYVTGKIVASAPITPGGLGTVEFALITALTAGGLGAHQAFAAVFLYRIVSFVLVALAGWVVFFLFYRGAVEVDPDAAPGDDTPSREDSSSSSSSRSVPVRSAVAAAPQAGVAAVWPMKGTPWRPTVHHDSGPIHLLHVRDDGPTSDESGEDSCSVSGAERRDERER
ncbi:lysylphosphatidylglycerol synthase transmembrane domain-containing protein [Dietzia psychralcaliphila]|uniref:lysylphosphatidylglycerol synthase transmembrane domain-containing protein n=1 Tax=Dietzia psychralcaliphila TaxID=139021 RepID=UPI001C1E2A00|nr:YbhN family protein [Dietzia psychralcaliphila]